jgi:hypothetical protein
MSGLEYMTAALPLRLRVSWSPLPFPDGGPQKSGCFHGTRILHHCDADPQGSAVGEI